MCLHPKLLLLLITTLLVPLGAAAQSDGDISSETVETQSRPGDMGSPYVPLDSWIYPAFDRLAAWGYVQSAYLGMRPWTRMECARLLQEAAEQFSAQDFPVGEAQEFYSALAGEFAFELARWDGATNRDARLDSVYLRTTGIAGRPLRDGYHFGQTLINDFGRPYGKGLNAITGITAHAVAGPFSVNLQGEYQHAGAVPSDAPNVLQAVARQDATRPLANGQAAIHRFRLLDSALAATFKNIRISFGKQSLWLGPSPGGPFLFSNNAEPIPMLRIDQASPVLLPGISRILGPARMGFALGRLSGTQWVFANGQLFGPAITDQPFVHVEEISFKPTPNFEFGMGMSVVFGGPGLPVTWGNLFRTFGFRGAAHSNPGTGNDPGDRRSAAEFSYRIPRLRDWVTLYGDSFVEDEVSPLGSSRPAVRAGLYFPRLPKAPKLDLRLEAVYTDVATAILGNYYGNARYRSGYTNDGSILGSWIGRAGKGGQVWATYWFSPRTMLQLQYRRQQVSGQFLGGGGLHDFGIRGELRPANGVLLQGGLQYEKWRFPLLAANTQSCFTASFQITFELPRKNSRAGTERPSPLLSLNRDAVTAFAGTEQRSRSMDNRSE